MLLNLVTTSANQNETNNIVNWNGYISGM